MKDQIPQTMFGTPKTTLEKIAGEAESALRKGVYSGIPAAVGAIETPAILDYLRKTTAALYPYAGGLYAISVLGLTVAAVYFFRKSLTKKAEFKETLLEYQKGKS